jgi:hypothetical protein
MTQPLIVEDLKYAIRAQYAGRGPRFVGLADTIEEARKIRFDAELAGFTGVVILDGELNKVERLDAEGF